MSDEIDTNSSSAVICPHCGHKDEDGWELFDGQSCEVRTDCGACEKPFIAIAEYSVDYQSVKACTATYRDGSTVHTCNLGEDHQSYRPHGNGRGMRWNDLGENATPHLAEEAPA